MREIDINGSSFEYEITGKGSIIFVMLSGYDELLDTWDKIKPEIEKFGRVFTYNRLGVGGSDQATTAQCGKSVISDLRKILELLNIDPPYILVGHSIGGLYVNLFGRLHPNEVCGAVLLDATHPDHEDKLFKYKPPLHVRLVNGFYDVLEYFQNRNRYTELKSFGETAAQIDASGSFPNIQLSVVAGNKKMLFEPDGLRELHISNQKELASISCKGKLIVAKNSGHFPQVSEPELVSGVIVRLAKSLGNKNNG